MKLLKTKGSPDPGEAIEVAQDRNQTGIKAGAQTEKKKRLPDEHTADEAGETVPPTSLPEASCEFRRYPLVSIDVRPGSASPYWEGKLRMPDGRVKKAVMNFVTHFNEIDTDDKPRRLERRYPLDPEFKKKKPRRPS